MQHVTYRVPSLTGNEEHKVSVPSLEDEWVSVVIGGVEYDLNIHTDDSTDITTARLYPLRDAPGGLYQEADVEAGGYPVTIAHSVSDISDDGSHCPQCGAGDDRISWDGNREFGEGEASQEARCSGCGCHWVTVYKFSHNQVLD